MPKSYLFSKALSGLALTKKPIYRFVVHHNSMSEKRKLGNHGMDLCKQYNAQHSLTKSLFLILTYFLDCFTSDLCLNI